MKNLLEITEILQNQKALLKERYNVTSLGIFGSYVHGKQKRNSDLDILIELEAPIGLIKFIELENYLSKILGVRVDLVMKDGLKKRIGKRILEETIPV